MRDFEKGHKAFRQSLGYQPYAEASHLTNTGLLVVADGLAEVIALLRPLVDTVTAQPEPLRRSNQCRSVSYRDVPGAREVLTCSLDAGHTGVHTDGDAAEVTW